MNAPAPPTAPRGYHHLKKTLREDLYVADHAQRTATAPICDGHVAHFHHDESEVKA